MRSQGRCLPDPSPQPPDRVRGKRKGEWSRGHSTDLSAYSEACRNFLLCELNLAIATAKLRLSLLPSSPEKGVLCCFFFVCLLVGLALGLFKALCSATRCAARDWKQASHRKAKQLNCYTISLVLHALSIVVRSRSGTAGAGGQCHSRDQSQGLPSVRHIFTTLCQIPRLQIQVLELPMACSALNTGPSAKNAHMQPALRSFLTKSESAGRVQTQLQAEQ